MVKATEVVYKYYEVEFALKRGNNDALAWFGLFLAGINKFRAELGEGGAHAPKEGRKKTKNKNGWYKQN